MNQENKLTKETFKVENFTFVDLGLPSGTQWATENAPGYYQFDEAVEVFGNNLPKGAAIVELIEECKVEWNAKERGLDITGPNGNSIFLPAAGWVLDGKLREIDEEGDYWSRMAYVPNYWSFAPNSQTNARYLGFSSTVVNPLNTSSRAHGFSVRPSREL